MDRVESKYREYRKVTGGNRRIGLMVPFGYPPGVEERGGPEAVYDECIKKKVKWEDLLNFHPPEDAYI